MIDQTQILYYQQKLKYEIDAWDLHQAIENGESVVILDADLLKPTRKNISQGQ